jgi:integrase/recombinase XerD
MKLSQAWNLYEGDKKIEGYSKHTLDAYRIQNRLLIEFLDDKELEEVALGNLKLFLAKDAGRLKPSSVNHRIKSIKAFFKWAHDEGMITQNPSTKLKHSREGNRIPKFVTEEVIELMRDACETSMERALFEFLFTSGCRIGEVHGLNRNAVDFDSMSCVVRGKGDKEREVYFTTSCQIHLKRYLKARKDTDMALFVTNRNPNRRMSIAQMRSTLKKIANRAGIEETIYPHKLRHTYATHLLNNGAPLEVIQSLLGHAKSETTRIYAHQSGRLRKEQYRKYF